MTRDKLARWIYEHGGAWWTIISALVVVGIALWLASS